MEVIDVHQHVGELASHGRVAKSSLEDDATYRVAAMDAAEIDWAIIQPSHSYMRPDGIVDTMRVNDSIAAFRALASDRFRIALGTVEPTHGERSLPEIVRCRETLGLNGLSWHHRFQGTPLDTPLMKPILGTMADLGLVPLVHTNANSTIEAPWRAQRLAQQFPQLTFLALDAFHNHEVAQQTLFIAEQTPNILWDLSGPLLVWNLGWDVVSTWIRRHGGERLVFGGDLAYSNTSRPPGGRSLLRDMLLASDLPEEAKAQILGGNVRRAFAAHLPS
jgi:predicted TIM-barrel fold metal-dependent hydrolase